MREPCTLRFNVKVSGRRRRSARLTCCAQRRWPTPTAHPSSDATGARNAGVARAAWDETLREPASERQGSTKPARHMCLMRPTGARGAAPACDEMRAEAEALRVGRHEQRALHFHAAQREGDRHVAARGRTVQAFQRHCAAPCRNVSASTDLLCLIGAVPCE